MTAIATLTWTIARAGGIVAFLLVTASVLIGIALDLKWRSQLWPRFITTEVHRFVTLLSLVFVVVHTLAVALDPFMGYSLAEVFVPLVSHYRTVWVALGIVAAYLLAALWLSEYLRPRVGYAWWRRFHAVAFVAYVLAVIHGLGTGSDTQAPWAVAMYAVSVLAVGGLFLFRLFPKDPRRPRHPVVAAVGVFIVVELVLWTALGPLQPGWNEVANGGRGTGQVTRSP